MTKWERPLLLASVSLRRAALLEAEGYAAITTPPTVDDGLYACGSMKADKWVQVLAVLKARSVLEQAKVESGTILSADTVCVVDSQILGQPTNSSEAKEMIESMTQRTHEVYTGWCLLSIDKQHMLVGCEVVEISIGKIDEDEITKYAASGQWKGKAGGYNLSERIEAGWPVVCNGDQTSVMGLPMERLNQELSGDT